MTDPEPLETRLRQYLRDLAEHTDSVPESRFLAQRPGPRRGRMGPRPSRAVLVRSLAAVCVIALVAVVGVRVLERNSSTGGREYAVLLTAAPVRFETVFAEPAGGQQDARRLMIFDSATRATRQVGVVDRYTYADLSPRGDLVGALAGDTLHLVNVSTGKDHRVALGKGTHGTSVLWSPDDAEVAVVGQHIEVVTASGTRLADITSPPSSGGYEWSPDGHWFTAIVNGVLIVFGRNGHVASAPLQRLLPGVDPSTVVAVAGWSASDDIVLGRRDLIEKHAPTLAEGWTVQRSGELTAVPGTDLDFTSTIPPEPHSATPSALDRFAPDARVLYARRTADGDADFYEVRSGPPSKGGAAPIIVIFAGGTTEAARLPSLTDTRNSDLVDAALVS